MDTSNTNRVKGRTIGKSTGAATSRVRALRRMLAAVFAPRARWRPRGPGSRSLVGRILAINMITLLIPVIGFLYTDRYRQLLIEGELEALRSEGRIIAEGPPASIGQNQAVVDAYLGSHHDSALDLEADL